MLRDGVTGNWIGSFAGHKGAVWSCRLDPTGCLAATASGDFSAKVWDAITGKPLWDLPHKHIVKCCSFSPNSLELATGGHEGKLRIYTIPTETTLAMTPRLEIDLPQKAVITKCIWLEDNKTVLAASSDGAIRCYDTSASGSAALKEQLKVDAQVRDMEMTALPDGRTILTVAAGKKVSFFHLHQPSSDGTSPHTLLYSYTMPIHFQEEGGASLHPTTGKRFVAGGSDLWVRVFDLETGEELECHKGHHGPIRCVRYAPDGKTYATGSEDGTIRLWKV